MRRITAVLIEDTKLQLNENLKPPIEIVEEIIKQIGMVTANYHRRKKMAAEADKRNIKDQIREQRAAISNFYTALYAHNPCDDSLEDIEEFLKDIEHETVSDLENKSLTGEKEVHDFIHSDMGSQLARVQQDLEEGFNLNNIQESLR